MTVAARPLLGRVAARMRTHDDVRLAWRSHCPRYAVWADAVTNRLVRVATEPDSGARVAVLTARGYAALEETCGRLDSRELDADGQHADRNRLALTLTPA